METKQTEPNDNEISSASDPDFMMSLARGLQVIQAFSQHRRTLTISQISQRIDISRASVRRCLHTLRKLGFVGCEDEQHFFLRPRILFLGYAYLASMPFGKAAQAILYDISAKLKESSSIAVLEDHEIVYIARENYSRIMAVDLSVGSRLPAAHTSMGRVLLAYLTPEQREASLRNTKWIQYTKNTLMSEDALDEELLKVREQGYAIVDQELEIGLRSIAVPIMTSEGKVVSALNAGLHASRSPHSEMKKNIFPILSAAAKELSLLVEYST
jgi:IclR family pca regulon transcriptional regulator